MQRADIHCCSHRQRVYYCARAYQKDWCQVHWESCHPICLYGTSPKVRKHLYHRILRLIFDPSSHHPKTLLSPTTTPCVMCWSRPTRRTAWCSPTPTACWKFSFAHWLTDRPAQKADAALRERIWRGGWANRGAESGILVMRVW
jgi:hypothetical protein